MRRSKSPFFRRAVINFNIKNNYWSKCILRKSLFCDRFRSKAWILYWGADEFVDDRSLLLRKRICDTKQIFTFHKNTVMVLKWKEQLIWKLWGCLWSWISEQMNSHLVLVLYVTDGAKTAKINFGQHQSFYRCVLWFLTPAKGLFLWSLLSVFLYFLKVKT